MKKQLVIVVITLVLLSVGLSGCTDNEQPESTSAEVKFRITNHFSEDVEGTIDLKIYNYGEIWNPDEMETVNAIYEISQDISIDKDDSETFIFYIPKEIANEQTVAGYIINILSSSGVSDSVKSCCHSQIPFGEAYKIIGAPPNMIIEHDY